MSVAQEIFAKVSVENKILSVTELTRRIKSVLAANFGVVTAEGEISNTKQYSSGHTYFVLKDATAQINAVLFAGDREKLAGAECLKDGQKVRVAGQISVFEGRGQYQLVVRRIESAGTGELMERYEKLKQKLLEEGLFDASHKKPLPLLPRRVGVVTSPTGAVIHDMLNVLARRFPNMNVLLTPVRVQGEGAADSIAGAIRWLNSACGRGSAKEVDVIIVGRGGGSLEDLWAFNEEAVARAIYDSTIPVVSAVGHEVDYALSDFVADLRAPTPSAAAELVVRPKIEFENLLINYSADLKRLLVQRRDLLKEQLLRLSSASALTRPGQTIARYAQRIDHLEMRLLHVVRQDAVRARQRFERSASELRIVRERRCSELRNRICRSSENMRAALRGQCDSLKNSVVHLDRQLMLLNPLKVLDRGYSLTRRGDGSLVRSVRDVEPGSGIVTVLKDGRLESIVK